MKNEQKQKERKGNTKTDLKNSGLDTSEKKEKVKEKNTMNMKS